MNWWDQPVAEKSEQEREYDRLSAQYTEMFGQSYANVIGYAKPMDEVIADLRNCIETGRPQRLPTIPENIET